MNKITVPFYFVLCVIGFLMTGCGGGSGNATPSDIDNTSIQLENLQTWQRHDEPVLRDPEPGGSFEVAADPHVFRSENGELAMVYSGSHPSNDYATIKLAVANTHTDWVVSDVLLTGSNSGNLDLNKETSFYRLSKSGKHQIFYIGYEDESIYNSQIFMAEADALEGPYELPTTPIIPTMVQDGLNVVTMTSPSVIEHEGRLYMVYCAWNGFPDPSIVRIHGAISDDDGVTWDIVGEVQVPSCMEGLLTKGPDGLFYAVGQADDGFVIGRSEEPFPENGYEMLPQPIMTPLGEPWEVDEMNTPQIFFDGNEVYLYYSGADYSKGWWVMLATTSLTN